VMLGSWPERGSDGEVLLKPYVPKKRITGDDDLFKYNYVPPNSL
jgi:hypothetical protein